MTAGATSRRPPSGLPSCSWWPPSSRPSFAWLRFLRSINAPKAREVAATNVNEPVIEVNRRIAGRLLLRRWGGQS